jgi:HEAT repeat protein
MKRSDLDHLARNDPDELLRLLKRTDLDPVELTWAAERVNQIEDSDAARAALLPLLTHPEAIVRQGAVFGLHRHVDAAVRAVLKEITRSDPSPSVRDAAHDALDGL